MLLEDFIRHIKRTDDDRYVYKIVFDGDCTFTRRLRRNIKRDRRFLEGYLLTGAVVGVGGLIFVIVFHEKKYQ